MSNHSKHLPGNPHAGNYETYIESEDRQIDTAIMALAFEQRTANLMAYYQWADAQGDLPDLAAEIWDQIDARLPTSGD